MPKSRKAKIKRPPERVVRDYLLDVRLRLTAEEDRGLADYIKSEAAKNRRNQEQQILFMCQFAAAQMSVKGDA